MFEVDQVVRGVAAGTFRILTFEQRDNEQWAVLQEVHPEDHSREHPTPPLRLPVCCLVPLTPSRKEMADALIEDLRNYDSDDLYLVLKRLLAKDYATMPMADLVEEYQGMLKDRLVLDSMD